MNYLQPQSVWPLPRPLFMAGRYCEHDLPYIKLEGIDEEKKEWIVLGSDGIETDFHVCVPKMFLKNYETVNDKIQEWGNRMENGMVYRPLLFELCVVKIVRIWRRCKLVGKDNTGILVYTNSLFISCLLFQLYDVE